MDDKLFSSVSGKLKRYRRKRIWNRLVKAMAVIVVFCTTYALILPAITLQQELICDKEEHIHSEECYTEEKELICDKTDEMIHEHNEECYKEENVFICTEKTEQVIVHEHDETCYQQENQLTCTEEHGHNESCYTLENILTCTTTEEIIIIHEHTDTCYELQEILICEEQTVHEHIEECYQTNEILTCDKEEHEHIDSCYKALDNSDPSADIETKEDWEATLNNLELTDNNRENLVLVAQSQLGYKESTLNFSIAENGDVYGYTRYGQYYNDIYSEWNHLFVGFCIDYSKIEGYEFNVNFSEWINTLYELEMIQTEYNPLKGDLIFFDINQDTIIDQVGIITEIKENSYVVIEGDINNQVSQTEYTFDNNTIIGYGITPINFEESIPIVDESIEEEIKNSISIFKVLSQNDDSIEVLGNPNYYFQILLGEEVFSKDLEYQVYDNQNNLIDTRIADSKGIFILKANQKAVFEEMIEEDMNYVIQELFEDSKQYAQITVNETIVDIHNEIVSIEQDVSIENITFNNQIDVTQLGKLSITNQVIETEENTEDKTFDIYVTLDDNPIPIGTQYYIQEQVYEVLQEGIVTFKKNQTIIIPNILAGTEFTLKETQESSEGYVINYPNSNTFDQNNESIVTGKIEANTVHEIIVENIDGGIVLKLPITKSLNNYDLNTYTYLFELNQVSDLQASEIIDNTKQEMSIQVNNNSVIQYFDLTYTYSKLNEGENIFYYKINEIINNEDEATVYDEREYIVEICVNKILGEETLQANITNIWCNGNKVEEILFENMLIGDLSIKKLVNGNLIGEDGFEFTIQLLNIQDIPLTQDIQYQIKDEIQTITLDQDGKGIFTLNQNETITIFDLPCGTKWIITETETDDYDVAYVINDSSIEVGNEANGSIVVGSTDIEFTNYAKYELPETGGNGTHLLKLGGVLIMMMTLIVYLILNRREEVQ